MTVPRPERLPDVDDYAEAQVQAVADMLGAVDCTRCECCWAHECRGKLCGGHGRRCPCAARWPS